MTAAESKKEKRDVRERLFAYLCAVLGNSKEAAARAGYHSGEADHIAEMLLERADIRKLVEKNARRLIGDDLAGLALQGLLRLAFGSANDVARLILDENGTKAISSEELAGLDLFLVSELKRPKGGGWEVKLHDRAQALQFLLNYAASRENSETGSFYQALRESAAAAAAGDAPDAI